MSRKNRKTKHTKKSSIVLGNTDISILPVSNTNNISKITFYSVAKEFITKNFVGLFGIAIAITIAVVTYQLTTLEPDLRPTKTELENVALSDPVRDTDGNCNYYATFNLPFKNTSWRTGYIDKVTFANATFDALPKFELIELDRSPIAWNEEKEIEISLLFKADSTTCEKLGNKEPIGFGVKFFDNKGKLINQDINGNLFDFGFASNH